MITKSKLSIFGNLFAGLALLVVAACQPMKITDVNFSEPIESVLEVGSDGVAEDINKGISFNVLALQKKETGDDSSVTIEEIRMIRGHKGHYFVIAPGFTHVYVFNAKDGNLVLEEQIKVDENGVASPAFNQRDNYIQLIDGTSRAFNLTHEGLRN